MVTSGTPDLVDARARPTTLEEATEISLATGIDMVEVAMQCLLGIETIDAFGTTIDHLDRHLLLVAAAVCEAALAKAGIDTNHEIGAGHAPRGGIGEVLLHVVGMTICRFRFEALIRSLISKCWCLTLAFLGMYKRSIPHGRSLLTIEQ